jgi:hypothetical protein
MLVGMQARPISPTLLVEHVADRIMDTAGVAVGDQLRTRVALDGAPSTDAAGLGARLAEALRARGRAALLVSAWDFLRPASLRFELGRDDPDLFYTEWFDVGALRRHVLAPAAVGGSGRVLPSLWDAATDRATRAAPVDLPSGAVVLLHGPFLLTGQLSFDLSVHLWQSPAALGRRLPPDERWTLPAYLRYAAEVRPERHADIVVRDDDPRHPALAGQC